MCERVCVQVAHLVGPDSSQSLFSRSIRLVQVEHSCLARIVATPEPIDRMADRLRYCLSEQEPATMTEIAVDLIATLLTLLASLIGDPLTEQALRGTSKAR